MTYKYHHLHLICNDLDQMTEFFSGTLGAKLVERRKFGTADGATLDLNGCPIYIRVPREDEGTLEDASQMRRGYDHLGLEVEDVDAAYNQLVDKGFTFPMSPNTVGNVRIAFLKGPENITIELLQHLK